MEAVIADVNIGERKNGDLSWLRVYKFKTCGRLTLLGYMVNTNDEIVLTFVDIGSHENFYRDLKK
ncbi:MAG: type II toxin-antitoxin system RelE/ParE family toxin [Chitinispirillales bacterium]|nr:type II toxin-antitoxin system RelE/ParE family toxin [Chitinispirillales bacterium]